METKQLILGMTEQHLLLYVSRCFYIRTEAFKYIFKVGYKTVSSSQLKCEIKILMFINRIVKKTTSPAQYSLFNE